ncbi:MAG: hypothetical protein HY763_02315 [Planctomycetes bacterium]|nr:hypothetical protein [Planctomycetota bacterium]
MRLADMVNARLGLAVASLLFGAPVAARADGEKASPKNKARVTLVAEYDGVEPGKPFDVGMQFKLDEGWHIYWQNPGDAGIAPRATWTLPDGFTAGEFRFPVPKRHVDGSGIITTNILEDEPVLLTRIAPPAAITAKKAAVAAKVTYLVCRETCLQERAEVSVELPVAAAPAKATHAELFERARKRLPATQSKYVQITPKAGTNAPAPGQPFELVVDVNITDGHHIQSHAPLSDSFIKCDLFVERTAGIFFKEPVYPEPSFRELPVVGKVSEYKGRITIRVPGEVEEPPAPPARYGGVLAFQACDEKGHCFPPEAVAFALPVGTASAAPAATTKPDARAGGVTEAAGPRAAASSPPESGSRLPGFLGRFGIAGLLAACFLYGLSINATPCVLPLLSIKVLGFVQQAHESRRRTLALGLTFGAGVLLFFVLLGFLAAAGKNVLQYPAAVIALSAIVLAMALSMLGVYTLQAPTAAANLEARISREGLAASFGKGALAPVLGFACTGPLLAGAWGWATQQPPHIAVLAFIFAGLGMAAPYMLLGANPNWLGFLPRPGNWMITFERIMGFLLLGMVVWLLHPLIAHVGAEGLEWTLVFFVSIAAGCWLLGVRPDGPQQRPGGLVERHSLADVVA